MFRHNNDGGMPNMFGGRPIQHLMPPPQLHHQPEQEQPTFYDPALAFPPPTYHGQAQIDPTATWAGGLPEDDDPLLQRRLQQLVEQHRPSSRNVLRELADVAEQQSGSKRKGAFDDEDADDLSMEAAAAATDEDLASSRNKDGNKRRQDSLLPGFISRARRQMDEVLAKRNTLRSSVRSLENQLKNIQKLYEDEKAQFNEMDRVVYETGKELCDELLEENTTWNQLYHHLVEFHANNGHLKVPWRKDNNDPVIARLGPWLVQQRKDYRRSEQDPERLEPYKMIALEKLNIEWEPTRSHWFSRFQELKRFKEKFGHCRVPYCSKPAQKKQRRSRGNEDDEYDDDNGDDDNGEENEQKVIYDSLGVWLKRQRSQYKDFKAGNKDKTGEIMTEERIQMLEEVGVEWSLRPSQTQTGWNDNYEQLKRFKEDHGHTRVEEKTNKGLFDWLKNMRQYMKRYNEDSEDNVLSPRQYQLLKDLEVEPTLRESKFEARFCELTKFIRLHGHSLVPAVYPANQKLSNWVQTQRRQYKLMKEGKKSQMTEDKCQLLIDAGFEFEVPKERKSLIQRQMVPSWDEFYAELNQYKEKYGKIDVIRQSKKKALRNWCDEQRVQHARMKWGKKSTITPEQIQKLTAIGFTWTTVDEPSKGWDDFYGDLLAFYIKNRTFDVPEDQPELRSWVEIQKAEYKKYVGGIPSFLTKLRIDKLDEVNFPFSGDKVSPETKLPLVKKSWEEMFGQLLAFNIKNHHFHVPDSMKELHTWSCHQRQQKIDFDKAKSSKKKRSAIWEERLKRLTDVNFNWDGELPAVRIGRRQSLMTSSIRNVSGTSTEASLNIMPSSAFVPLQAMQFWPVQGSAIPLLPHTNMMPPQVITNVTDAANRGLADEAARIVADTNTRHHVDHHSTMLEMMMAGEGGVTPTSPQFLPIAPAPEQIMMNSEIQEDDVVNLDEYPLEIGV